MEILEEPTVSGAVPTGDDLSAWIEAHRVRSVSSTLADLSGLDRARRSITALAYAITHPDEVRAAGGFPPRAVLLVGPVGCGKTSLARGLARIIADDGVFIEVAGSELGGSQAGPSGLAAISRFADSQSKPTVIFIDELSSIGLDRNSRTHDGESRAALFALLSAISGLRDPGLAPVLWLGATSDDPSDLDSALTRAGRFSRTIRVRMPNAPARRDHLARQLARRRTSGPIDLERLVALTHGLSHASLDQFLDDSVSLALHDGGPAAGMDQRHLEEALAAAGEVDEDGDPSAAEKWRTAAHESAHGIVGHLLLGPGEVKAMTIHRAGGRAGRTSIGPADDDVAGRPLTNAEMRARAGVFLAGAIGERLLLGDASAGCEDDAEKAGRILLDAISSGSDPAWPAAWPGWPSSGPAYEDRRAAAVTATIGTLTNEVQGLLAVRRTGLEGLARILVAAGDLAGPELDAALVAAATIDVTGVV